MNTLIYEDDNYKLLHPFTINHATFEVRVGAFTNLERFINSLDYDCLNEKIVLAVRDEIKEIIEERYADWKVISIHDRYKYKDYQQINGSSLNDLEKNKITYLWDAFKFMNQKLEIDFENYFKINPSNTIDSQNVVKINDQQIYIGENVSIHPGVVLDASNGPIIISSNVKVGTNSVLEGPLFIGSNSEISPLSLIRGSTSIGPFCKIGGEVSCSIFQGYSNKVHHGFIGNSYIGEWVNIGAGTNNSNLKNNYGDVKILFEDKIINTEIQFMGVLIGDYSRIAIGTNLNTGTYISIGANIFNYDLKDRYIKPFSWGMDKKVNFNRFIETIGIMKERRNENISKAEKKYLKFLYEELKSN